jgi:hypothetical protein
MRHLLDNCSGSESVMTEQRPTLLAQKAISKPLPPGPLSTPCHIGDVQGRVWTLSQEKVGSRTVQGVLDQCCDAEFEELALEFSGHVLEAASSPHANFVLLKCIDNRCPAASQAFALELIRGGSDATLQVAKHRYGCRIVEQLIECCDSVEADSLVDLVIGDAKETKTLCMHSYGNYTIQHILTHGSEKHRHRLLKLLQEDAVVMVGNFHASAVIGAALRRASRQDALALAQTIFQVPNLLAQMAKTKHGHAASKVVLELVESAKSA